MSKTIAQGGPLQWGWINGMRYYRIIPEANGTFTIYVNEVGTLPGTYTGFKSEAEANSWIAEQQKHPDLPPFL
jgi:hypothetical protein